MNERFQADNSHYNDKIQVVIKPLNSLSQYNRLYNPQLARMASGRDLWLLIVIYEWQLTTDSLLYSYRPL